MALKTDTRTLNLDYVDTVGFVDDQGGRGFQLPTALALNSQGNIYVVSRSRPDATRCIRVSIVTLDHDYLGQFGGYGAGDGQFIWPTAIAFDSDDNIYLADEYTQRITIYDPQGSFRTRWQAPGSGDGQFDGPAGLAFDSKDNLYVVDSRNNRVQKLTRDGKFLASWGGPGAAEGQFNLPWGICVDGQDNVYVADWRNDRVQKFTPDGQFIASFGASGSGDGQFHRPSDVAVDDEGYIYVADWGNQRVQVLDSTGGFQMKLRGQGTLSPWAQEYLAANADEYTARQKFVPTFQVDVDDPHEESARVEPYFWDPVSLTVDREGRLYVLETNRHRFQVYQKA